VLDAINAAFGCVTANFWLITFSDVTGSNGNCDVRFCAEADIGRRQEFVRLRATSGHCAVSLDQLVSEPEQLRWNCDAECFGSF
jgi:hypothetical protein